MCSLQLPRFVSFAPSAGNSADPKMQRLNALVWAVADKAPVSQGSELLLLQALNLPDARQTRRCRLRARSPLRECNFQRGAVIPPWDCSENTVFMSQMSHTGWLVFYLVQPNYEAADFRKE